jgi:hypothetical protein
VLAVVAVTLRLCLRVFHRNRRVKWDDYLMVPAMVRFAGPYDLWKTW